MQESIEQQLFFMRWAIQLGEKGRLTAPPNPWVGCVIVKDGEIIAEGFHEKAGKEHAEVVALNKAGKLARGACAYITLEPCAHHGKTPPCVNALINAGIKKVIIPFADPDPQVAGKGIEKLKEAGVEVVIGIAKEEAASSLEAYLHHRKTKLPFIVLKAAMSLDGRTAAHDGSSQWITGEQARKDAHILRAGSQAVLIGTGTALKDSPTLTVRAIEVQKQPLRVILDPKGAVPPKGPLADTALAPTLLITCASEQKKTWENFGAEVIVYDKINLKQILEELAKRDIVQLLVEGGSHVHSSFLKEGLANKVILYVGGCLLGEKGLPLISDFQVATIGDAPRWQLLNVFRLGNDVRLDFLPGNQMGE